MKNAIRQRMPKTAENLNKLENKFVDSVEKTSLQALSLDELVHQFYQIEQQGQLLQGRILLEARERFKSDKEFGQWCTQSICLGSQPQRTRLMNLARFFKGREIEKIGISVAYLISSPEVVKAGISEEVYDYARSKKLSVDEVKKHIEQRMPKAESKLVKITQEKTTVAQENLESRVISLVDTEIKNPTEAIKLLQRCIAQLKIRHGY